MRRALAFLAVLLLALLLAWWALRDELAPGPAGPGAADPAAEIADDPALDPVTGGRRPRDRAKPGERPRAEAVAGFLGQWPEVGQDREQDPALGAISGRVLVAPGEPPAEAVVEATARGELLARVRLRGAGDFLLKNVAPGGAVALTARAEGHAPGGLAGLIVPAGKVTSVGTIYVGLAMDPDVDNRVEVEVTAGGKPVPAAQVTATTVYYGALVSLGNYEKQPGGTVLRAETGPDGRAVFGPIPPSQYDFFAEKEGFAFEGRARQVVQKATKTTIRLAMSPAQTIEGRLVTPDGKPVPGARIVVLRWGNFANFPSGATDDDGRFVLGGLTGGSYMLVFAKEGMGAKDVQNVAAGKKDLVVTIDEGGDLAIRCTDSATGKPVLAFGVRPYRKVPFGYLFAPILEARTADGVFRTKLLPGTDYGAEVSADGYAVRNVATLAVGAAEPVDVALDPAGIIRGRVVGRGTAKPVRGAQVFVKRGGFPPSRVKEQQTVTDAGGLFTLTGLSRTPVSFTVSHVDHDEATFEGVEPGVRGADGSLPAPRDFELGSGGRIEGRIVAPTREPEAGVAVQLLVGFDFLNGRATTTDAQGRYAFEHVPVARGYTVVVGQAGPGRGGRNRTDVAVAEGQTTVVDFVPETGGQKVTGRAVRDEKPAAGVTVSMVADDGGQFTGNERTRADGTFVFESVPAGRYVVSAQGAKVQNLTVRLEEPPAEIVLALSSAYLSGRVVDATTGEALGGVWVDCEQVADASGSALPDLVRRSRGAFPAAADGTFTFRGLDDGAYQVRAVRDGYGTEIADGITIANGASLEGVVVRLGPGCTVTGTVRNAAGTPVEGAALTARDSKGRRAFIVSLTQSGGDGTYSQGTLRPDTYDLTFEKDGYAPATKRVTLETAAPARVDFVLMQGGRIEVTVRGADGAAVKDAVVTLFDSAGQAVSRGVTLSTIFSTNRTRTDANGQVVLAGVAPGVYRVAVQVAGREGVLDRPGVEAVEGALTPVEVVVPSGR